MIWQSHIITDLLILLRVSLLVICQMKKSLLCRLFLKGLLKIEKKPELPVRVNVFNVFGKGKLKTYPEHGIKLSVSLSNTPSH